MLAVTHKRSNWFLGLSRHSSAVLLGLGLTTGVALAADRPVLETFDVRVGMPMAEASDALKKRGLTVQVADAQYFPRQTFPWVVMGRPTLNDATKLRDHIWAYLATPPSEPRVVAISRMSIYPPGKGPAVDSLLTAMKEKFGTPLKEEGPIFRRDVTWSWNKDGHTSPPDKRNTCITFLRFFEPQGGMTGGPFTLSVSAEKFMPPIQVGCNSGVRITTTSSDNGISANRITVVAVNFEEADAVIRKTIEHNRKVQESIDAKASEAAKKVKPDL
jgi:hypothetical protein